MVVLLAGLIVGCGIIEKSDTAQLSIKLTDAPAEGIDQVWVTITKVEISKEDAGKILLRDFGDDPFEVDLLTLRFDETLLGENELPVGTYHNIWLTIDDSVGSNYVVRVDGTEHDLKVPSNRFKIPHTFTILEGDIVELVLDADIKGFINLRGNEQHNNGYCITSTAIRVIDKKVTANLVGRVLDNQESPIVDVNVDVNLYDEDDEIVVGTIALVEDLYDNDGELRHPAGSFIIKGISAGNYTLEVKAEGYGVYTSEPITVIEGENQTLETINLIPIEG